VSTTTQPRYLKLPHVSCVQATHFQTTKRAAVQRKDLIRQSGGRSYAMQAATLSSAAEQAHCHAVLSDARPVVHNLRDSKRNTPIQQVSGLSIEDPVWWDCYGGWAWQHFIRMLRIYWWQASKSGCAGLAEFGS